ncbi:MAG: aminomethyl-transferring glycine dehydrogenase subunit GcvPA, partial [Clostridia bacterium]|nr:aminomethyl-transferring glycine dehydrogenase subunit GcvPA [Clostridia bacterium]
TGMDVANASMYDGATALAEGMIMAVAQTNKKKVLLSSTVHPEYREVIKTYAWAREIEIIEIPYTKEGSTDLDFLDQTLTNDFAAVIIQNPNFFGKIEKLKTLIDRVKSTKALSIVCADPISLGILEAPGKLGADIVVGEGQSLGMPLSFGGPYLGFIATTEKLIRRIPGRIVGLAKDQHGKDGFVLTLQAREQHIRREKASSNICSNQALCALTAIIYLSALGKKGLKEVAEHCISKAHYAQKVLTQIDGVELAFPQGPSFKEFVVKTKEDIACINDRLFQAGILGGLDLGRFYPELKNHMLICVTEARSKTEIDLLKQVWEGLA